MSDWLNILNKITIRRKKIRPWIGVSFCSLHREAAVIPGETRYWNKIEKIIYHADNVREGWSCAIRTDAERHKKHVLFVKTVRRVWFSGMSREGKTGKPETTCSQLTWSLLARAPGAHSLVALVRCSSLVCWFSWCHARISFLAHNISRT